VARAFHPAFALLLVALLALAPRCTDPEEGTPLAASGASAPDGMGDIQDRPDAAPFPVPTSFPGEGR
jgi:hypothetical protein